MRQFDTVAAPLERVLAVYHDVGRWHEWRPGLKRVRILERAGDRIVAMITQQMAGGDHDLKMELELRPDGFRERQIRGWVRKWAADWRFRASPDGRGTVIEMEVELELGLLGLFVSRRRVHNIQRRMFHETARRAERRASETVARDQAVVEIPDLARRIRISRTASGLEVWLDDQRYIAVAVDSDSLSGSASASSQPAEKDRPTPGS